MWVVVVVAGGTRNGEFWNAVVAWSVGWLGSCGMPTPSAWDSSRLRHCRCVLNRRYGRCSGVRASDTIWWPQVQQWRVVSLPKYLVDRVVAVAPSDCGVLGLSTPIVAFGNARIARVATLGLNPSRAEFMDNGHERVDLNRRLATRRSLGRSPGECFTVEDAHVIVEACDSYFTHNPYRRGFGQLEPILNAVGASYWPGMIPACHLDVSQWATDPVWGTLRSEQRRVLIEDGLPFLRAQLERHLIELLLVNGAGAMRPISKAVQSIHSEHLDNCAVSVGTLGEVRVVAWATNLQSSYGVSNEFRGRLANRVAALTRTA